MEEGLICDIMPVAALQDRLKQEMFSLFSTFYKEVNQSIFHKDLMSKDWVIIFREVQSKKVQGFTSLLITEHRYHDLSMTVVYSGDTLVHRSYWHSRILAKSWIKAVLDLTREEKRPLYWLLLSSGYRTYRYLPLFFIDFFPCYHKHTPTEIKCLITDIANRFFGRQYDPDTGIVRFAEGATPLRDDFSKPSEFRTSDTHIKFFIDKNPGHARGDELVCFTEICAENFTKAGKRMAR